MTKTAKLSDFYNPETPSVLGGESVKLADIVPCDLTITRIARVPFGDSVSYAYLTEDSREILTSAFMFVQIGDALSGSENATLSEDQPAREGAVAFDLSKPVKIHVERETTNGGRTFYRVTDE